MKGGGPLNFIDAIKTAGGQPGHASIWLGPWSSVINGVCPSLTTHLLGCRTRGVEPIIQVFDAGDQNTEAFWDGGVTTKRGANLGQWWELIKAIGTTLGNANMKGLVVIEPEWHKATLADGAPMFDMAWADAAHTIRRLAPGTKIVNCPGEWVTAAQVKAYPKMVAATDIWGVQNLRCLTKDSQARYMGGPNALRSRLQDYKQGFPGKPLIVTDMGYSTYGGAFAQTEPFGGGSGSAMDNAQTLVFNNLLAMLSDFESLGVTEIVARDLIDVDMSDDNYYGRGEDHWGVVRRDGTKKPGYSALIGLASVVEQPKLYTQAQMDTEKALTAAANKKAVDALNALGAAYAEMVKLQDRLNRIDAITEEQ